MQQRIPGTRARHGDEHPGIVQQAAESSCFVVNYLHSVAGSMEHGARSKNSDSMLPAPCSVLLKFTANLIIAQRQSHAFSFLERVQFDAREDFRVFQTLA